MKLKRIEAVSSILIFALLASPAYASAVACGQFGRTVLPIACRRASLAWIRPTQSVAGRDLILRRSGHMARQLPDGVPKHSRGARK
jgi:hypothetical protein